MATLDEARSAKDKIVDLQIGFAGVGITKVGESYAIKVNILPNTIDPLSLSNEIDGVPIVYEIVGKVSKRFEYTANK